MKLPNLEHAYIDMHKITDYVLDPTRDEGGGKAHVFEVALGITLSDAEFLKNAIQTASRNYEAVPTQKTLYGQKYEVQFQMEGLNGKVATVLTVWIVRVEEDFPRLVTAYVL